MLSYTPRKILAWYNLTLRRKRKELLSLFTVIRIAANGEQKVVKDFLKSMED